MSGTNVRGTSLEVDVVNAVDGDTIKVDLDGEEENVRLLALDTEESWAGGNKPVTPWGTAAKEKAEDVFPEGTVATLEFPGTEPLEECLRRYRGNYGRPLAYLHANGEDYQETMIREGYSPYFTKYGYAHFDTHDRRYREAERQAQADAIGVWNQLQVNGAEMRDYDSLTAWWELRAETIETFRRARRDGTEELFDSRLDYDELEARVGEHAVVFTELSSYRRVGQSHAVVNIGSQAQPFKLFLPNAVETAEGQRALSLLDNRYIADSDGVTVAAPRRSYAYIAGDIEEYRDEPEIEITSPDQIRDGPPSQST
ncbi:thermonuclease family protein [Natrinema salaciae]|uniref:Micrococcal nuclease n=1 Tax=Natrinema salaciae TaxID=1186196 RepID=A0A1H9BZZ4_9EURY|nr:thermonuclease family protein [Natrinema salaciae]SEP94321.1 micrococcal nuclease [Natrinema salaciae]